VAATTPRSGSSDLTTRATWRGACTREARIRAHSIHTHTRSYATPAYLHRFLERRIEECAELNGKRERKIGRLELQLSRLDAQSRDADAKRATLDADLAKLKASPELEPPHPKIGRLELQLSRLDAQSRDADAKRATLDADLAELKASPELEPHPMLRELLDKFHIVVDVFHFKKNHKVRVHGIDTAHRQRARAGLHATACAHKLSTRIGCASQGAFCHKYCNPHNVQLLEDARADATRNMSVAEQRFSKLSLHRHSMNNMNRQRFQFMLMVIMMLDIEAWAAGKPKRT
jgi:hypothetical protein